MLFVSVVDNDGLGIMVGVTVYIMYRAQKILNGLHSSTSLLLYIHISNYEKLIKQYRIRMLLVLLMSR